MSRYLATALLTGSLWASCFTQAETVSLQPSADTALWERDPTYNFGAETELVAGSLAASQDVAASRILYKFDLAGQLPEGATIESAELEFTVVKTPPGGASSTFALHRVLRVGMRALLLANSPVAVKPPKVRRHGIIGAVPVGPPWRSLGGRLCGSRKRFR